ncbi:MAG: hypothetical protein ACK5Z2_19900 [Bacteroidota bacterium]|jgi:hypothetical protein
MTPDTHSHNVTPLSAQLLQDYVQNKLSASDRMRVKRLLSESELAATAAAGFAAVPDAFQDIASLQAEIAARSGMSGGSAPASKSWMNWLAGGAGVAAVVVAAWAFWPKEEKVIAESKTLPQVQPQTEIPTIAAEETALSPVTDHFVNPKSKPVTVQPNLKTTEPVVQTNDVPLQPVVQPEKPVVTVVPPAEPAEVKPKEPDYNFPIVYILDLKITDYNRIYNKPLKSRKLTLTGTPASQEERNSGSQAEEEIVTLTADQLLRDGLKAFRAGRYGRCISKFEELLKNTPDDINAKFYIAVSYVKLEMHSKAIPLLDAVIESENNAFREEAEWYKALALIGSGDTDEAKDLLKKISGDNTFYSKQAAEKLKTL